MNFWHISDSGSKFEILKPNSSWLTFGISKFVSLSISHFLFLFLQLFLHCAVIYQHCAIILAITSQNYYHFGYYISNSHFLAITSQNYYHFGYYSSNSQLLAITSQNYYHFGYSISRFISLSYCIKLNIDTNHHAGHFSCKS